MSTALITGATAGIGAAFARRLAAAGDDLILVARNDKRLADSASEMKEVYGVEVRTIAADLTRDGDCATVADAAAEVDLLVNNAGMGLSSGFTANALADEERQLDLNVRAILRLTHAALPAMRERRRGAIVNVSSVAGFGPTMPGSTYNASKAWVTGFSESMAPIARRRGVSIMALCPGFVRTEFHERAGISIDGIPQWMWLDADYVVETAMRDLVRGKVVCVPSLTYKVLVSVIRHLPNRLLTQVTQRMEAISRRGNIT
ncbi:MAG: SDR family NAD(P)-dependent oxidoreductase [Stackebrandtia sp.]